MRTKHILWALMLILTITSASALYIVDTFSDDIIDTAIWQIHNESGKNFVIEQDGYLNFTGELATNFNEVYVQAKRTIGITKNGTISMKVKKIGAVPNTYMSITLGNHTFNQVASTIVPSCGVRLEKKGTGFKYTFFGGSVGGEATIWNTGVEDNNWHDIEIEAKRHSAFTEYKVSFDGTSKYWNDTACPNVVLNASLSSWFYSTTGNSSFLIDDYVFSIEEQATCTEPCFINDTFDFDDSICSHNWIAGTCNDLNVPINGQYVCNDSSQVIARYFDVVTSASGIVSISYDLEIGSDYDVIMQIGASDSVYPAVRVKYDGGTLSELRDNTDITTYNYNTSYNYEFQIDLTSFEYDVYVDDALIRENIRFFNDVNDLYWIAFQPDYNKGAPYCDYTLDNLLMVRDIAEIPVAEGGEVLYFGTINLDNGSFTDTKCRENENADLCFWRVGFEDVVGSFSDYFFSNFLIFLVLIIILVIFFILRAK